MTAVDLCIGGETAEFLHHSRVHHLRGSLEEPAGTSEEESVASEDDPVVVLGDVVADVARGVAGSEEARYLETSNTVTVSVPHKPAQISPVSPPYLPCLTWSLRQSARPPRARSAPPPS